MRLGDDGSLWAARGEGEGLRTVRQPLFASARAVACKVDGGVRVAEEGVLRSGGPRPASSLSFDVTAVELYSSSIT